MKWNCKVSNWFHEVGKFGLLWILGWYGIWGCQTDDEDKKKNVISIGVISPLTVDFLEADLMNFAAVMAQTEINQSGGIIISGESKQIELIIRDDEGKVETAIAAVDALQEQGTQLIVGPSFSSVLLGPSGNGSDGLAQHAIQTETLLISSGATASAISDLNDDNMIWRTCPPDKNQEILTADYLLTELQKSQVAILYRDDSWGAAISSAFAEAFESSGGQIVSQVGFDPNLDSNSDYSSYLEILFAEPKPQAVYLISFPYQAPKISIDIVKGEHINETYRPTFFSQGIQLVDMIANGAPEVYENMHGIELGIIPSYENYQNFRHNLGEEEAGTELVYAAYTYDAVYLLAYAIAKSQSENPKDIAQVLQSISQKNDNEPDVNINQFAYGQSILQEGDDINYDGASGKLNFTANGDPGHAWYVIWRIVNGQQEVLEYRETIPDLDTQTDL